MKMMATTESCSFNFRDRFFFFKREALFKFSVLRTPRFARAFLSFALRSCRRRRQIMRRIIKIILPKHVSNALRFFLLARLFLLALI